MIEPTDAATPDQQPTGTVPKPPPAHQGRSTWPEVLAGALVGTARTGERAEALLDAAAALALRRRAGVALLRGADPPAAAVPDDLGTVGPAAAARAAELLAVDSATRSAGPLRDASSRLAVLAEWLAGVAVAGRRLPAELVPALLDTGRRHRALRPLIAPAAGPVAGWLATQRADWAYASSLTPAPSTVDDPGAWELGGLGDRVGYLSRRRQHDPAGARDLLDANWAAESPDDRAALLGTLATGLSGDDEALLERALDDRRAQVRTVALDLLARLPGSGYARRLAARATDCLDLHGDRIEVSPPAACDRAMRRDGVAPRPPAGVGERAWWLEEILARTPLSVWGPPDAFFARRLSETWLATVRRGLARAAASQHDSVWAGALVGPLATDVATRGRPDDRLLLETLYEAMPADALAELATAALARGLAGATAVGVERVLALCPVPWPPAVAEAVFSALDDQLRHPSAGWRVAGLGEVAGLRLAPGLAPRAVALAEQLRAARPRDPAVPAVERFAATLRYRHDMLKELA